MNLKEYLELKYGDGNLSITKIEAECFDIDYPLVGGWIDAHVAEITKEQLEKLANRLENKKSESAKKAYDFVSTLLRK